ncbi:hypothetical protein D2T31_12660 [Sinirhodobacter populi]|uniref:Uncharacterized protein n=1 Tax=Paenirhodobacter populi TaxID=2306993 RepID=A0A443K893_9RHOB|nr:hypothetical protein [Sinirhodobacter populi]RWR28950.1 hypothetical protein D2T31_12660 [Sinirhodobacter populi]
MNIKNRLRLPLGAQFWANDGSDIPEWLCPHMIDRPSYNGAFMIQTPLGRARVHKGYVVVEHLGKALRMAPPSIGSHCRVMPFQTLPLDPCLSQSDRRRHSSSDTTLPVHVRGRPSKFLP